jgi:hypothetical protein
MRIEYQIYQRLVWDAKFRRAFAKDRVGTIQGEYPEYVERGHFAHTATIPGLEEEAYRRMGALYRTSKEVFPRLHNVLLALGGTEFFETTLASFFRYDPRASGCSDRLEILEPFDGYVVVPVMWKVLARAKIEDSEWIEPAMQYEWAIWQARRVASGWPALGVTPPLPEGAALISTNFDLKALLAEIRRLEVSAVGSDIYRWRIKPAPGHFSAIVFVKNSEVFEANLDVDSMNDLKTAVQDCKSIVPETLRSTLERIGLVLATSFLCCSSEFAGALKNGASEMSDVIEPQPH